MLIVGAGMSGLVAANMFRKNEPIIIEAQKSLPNNHDALLRFRTDKVSNASGIPFKKVYVRKQINYKGLAVSTPTIAIANEYCNKVSGEYNDRSIWNLEPSYRYIAPKNFIDSLSMGCDIKYNYKFDMDVIQNIKEPIISTIPMFDLMNILGWNRKMPEFSYKSIWTIAFDIKTPITDLYQTTYYPNKDLDFYRMSITGNKVIVEFIRKPCLHYEYKGENLNKEQYIKHFLKNDFGIDEIIIGEVKESYQKYGKLIPIDDKTRKKFISWATNNYNIYSLGRWATHRQLLMDDVVQDANVINNLINSNNYNR